MTMRTVLFVAYGSGHIRMILPIAKALAESRCVQPIVLALTTAARIAREAGLSVVQFKDFVNVDDADAIALGRELMRGMAGPIEDEAETVAYLGLSMSDLIATLGESQAREAYERLGRQAFLPERTLVRILKQVEPCLLVATNSPRAERGAVLAAGRLGIPAVCMVDLFALDEFRWIGQPGYADRVCVLNEQVKAFLIECGRQPDELVVTGNPAFDGLQSPALSLLGQRIRREQGWGGKKVLLWPSQVEPAIHPFDGRAGDPALPHRLLSALIEWVAAHRDAVLCVRPRAGESVPELPESERIVVTGQDWPLPALLHAVDVVVTLNSTVGLEGFLAGARVIQVLGSVFDGAMPLARFGLTDAAVSLDSLGRELQVWTSAQRRFVSPASAATPRVLEVLREFL